jgi:hypothetical protein
MVGFNWTLLYHNFFLMSYFDTKKECRSASSKILLYSTRSSGTGFSFGALHMYSASYCRSFSFIKDMMRSAFNSKTRAATPQLELISRGTGTSRKDRELPFNFDSNLRA